MITFELKTKRDAGEVCAELEKLTGRRAGVTVINGVQVEIDTEMTAQQIAALKAAVDALEVKPAPLTERERIAALEARVKWLEEQMGEEGT